MTLPPYAPSQPGPRGPYPPGVYPPLAPPPSTTNGLGIAALVIGIVSILAASIPLVGALIGIPGGIVAVVLGLVGLRKKYGRGLAITGTILGALAVVIAVVASIAIGLFVNQVVDTVGQEYTVDYKATVSTGRATATWGTSNQQSKGFGGTWTLSDTVQGTSLMANLTVTGSNYSLDQPVSCEIKVNGHVVSSKTGTGRVNCTAPLIGQ